MADSIQNDRILIIHTLNEAMAQLACISGGSRIWKRGFPLCSGVGQDEASMRAAVKQAAISRVYTVKTTSTCFGYLSCIEQQMICNSDAQIGSK